MSEGTPLREVVFENLRSGLSTDSLIERELPRGARRLDRVGQRVSLAPDR